MPTLHAASRLSVVLVDAPSSMMTSDLPEDDRVTMGAATGEGECALPARLLRQVNRYTLFDVQEMAGVLGFEPRNGEIKTRCLTAWRYPNH